MVPVSCCFSACHHFSLAQEVVGPSSNQKVTSQIHWLLQTLRQSLHYLCMNVCSCECECANEAIVVKCFEYHRGGGEFTCSCPLSVSWRRRVTEECRVLLWVLNSLRCCAFFLFGVSVFPEQILVCRLPPVFSLKHKVTFSMSIYVSPA